jgi:hypothetical protein
MIQLLLALASALPVPGRMTSAGSADQATSPALGESSWAASESPSADDSGEEYCDITLPLILERRGRGSQAR